MPKISEELIEPLDGIVAKVLCYPIYSHLESLFLQKRLYHIHLSTTAFFIALISGLTLYYDHFLIGGILSLLALIICWLSWKLAIIRRISRFWITLGSILDRSGEAFIISAIILSSSIQNDLMRLVGVTALIGSLTVSYTATRSGREFGKYVWKGFSAYGATRDVRLTLIGISAIIGFLMWGLVFLAVLTFSVVIKRIIDIQSVE